MIRKFTVEDVKKCIPSRERDCNKADFGYIALIGGSERYSGAIRLANMANCAMRAGAGVVKLAACRSLKNIILPSILESTFYPLSDDGEGNYVYNEEELSELIGGVSVIAVGMGIGNTTDTQKAVAFLLNNYNGILIIDADGLNAVSKLCKPDASVCDILRTSSARIILTPHPKEFSRLCGLPVDYIKNNSVEVASDFASDNNVIVLLKGSETIITDGTTGYINDRGCPGMATAGSGDVLSGIIAALCGYNKDRLLEATAAGAYIAGAAGESASEEFGDTCMIASDTARHIASAIRSIQTN